MPSRSLESRRDDHLVIRSRSLAVLAALACLYGACATTPAGGTFPWPLEPRTCARVEPAEVLTLGPRGYHRGRSRLLVRRVLRPTRANLDLAAYHANMMLRQGPAGEAIRPGAARLVDPARPFGGVVDGSGLSASACGTPLTVEERRRPLAFSPLVDFLARQDPSLAAGLEDVRDAVRSETFGLPLRPGAHLQQVTTLYLHQGPAAEQELWVKVEFEPQSRLFADMPDEDGDGYPEVYGRLRAGLASPALVQLITGAYAGAALDSAAVHRWANELASYWYPSYNTDVEPIFGPDWPPPGAGIEAEVLEGLDPAPVPATVVIRGKPEGRLLYNVFVVDGVSPAYSAGKPGGGGPVEAPRPAVSPAPQPLIAALQAELQAHGGDYPAWAAQLAPVHEAIRAQLRRRPERLKALVGKGGFLFYRRSLEYVAGGDVQAQPAGKNPLAAIVGFKEYLAGLGVDFLLVPVPTKAEVFPDKLAGVRLPPGPLPLIHPHGRKFQLELSQAGVEVLDLLPRYLAARTGAGQDTEEPLYQPQDTHWTARGLALAAQAVAERARRYPWFSDLPGGGVAYPVRQVPFTREGDLVSRLAPPERRRYRPARLVGQQVLTPDGERPLEDDPQSPIVVLGDSFTGVYQRTDCGSAGVSAQLARLLGRPVDLVMSYGGGPNVRNTLLTRDEAALRRMRLVVWLLTARDFFNYWDDWDPLRNAPAGP